MDNSSRPPSAAPLPDAPQAPRPDAEEPHAEGTAEPSGRNIDPGVLRMLPWVAAIAFFMQSLDSTILNTALPAMARSLGEHPLNMQSVIVSYLVTVAFFIPASGTLADKFGIRRVFIFAIILFAAGSLACAVSQTLGQIVASRILQGVGGALLVPVGRLSLLRVFPKVELVRVLSFVTLPSLIGPLIGPTLGGFLVEYASWHWIFFINIPVAVLGVLAARRYMPNVRLQGTLPGFDWTGFLLFGGFMISASLALAGAGEIHLPRTAMILLGISAVLCLLIYGLHAVHASAPLFSPSLFRTRNFCVGIIGNLFARLSNGAMPFLTPLLLQVGLGYSAFSAGMTMIPMTLAAMGGKQIILPLIKRFGFRRVLTGNTFALGVFIAGFSFINADTPYPVILLIFALFGTVNSMQFTAMNTITLIDLTQEQAGSGNGMLAVVMQLSMSLGVAGAASVLGEFAGVTGLHTPPDTLSAFHRTYIFLGIIAVISSTIFTQVRTVVYNKTESS